MVSSDKKGWDALDYTINTNKQTNMVLRKNAKFKWSTALSPLFFTLVKLSLNNPLLEVNCHQSNCFSLSFSLFLSLSLSLSFFFSLSLYFQSFFFFFFSFVFYLCLFVRLRIFPVFSSFFIFIFFFDSA